MQEYIDYIWEMVTVEFMAVFFGVYFVCVWLAIIIWVWRDILRRTGSRLLQLFSVLLVIFLTPLGAIIYLLIRPTNTLQTKYHKEIEENLGILHEIVQERLEENTKK